ncbi:MAG: ABC transporter permease [Pirellulaceae bacterium]|nr:ABC transporter permease [Pirellulaceae bacterium]
MKFAGQLFQLLFRSQLGPLVALLVIVMIFTVADQVSGSGSFASWRNARVLSSSAALIAVPALGMTMIIIAGGIDLSAGTTLTLCGTVLASSLKYHVTAGQPSFATDIAVAVGLTLLTGCLCGLFNGVIISATQVIPFIVTLGTMTIFLGIGQIIAQQSTVYAPADHIPTWLQNLSVTGSNPDRYLLIPYVPTNALLAIVLACAVAVLLKYTIFGRNIFALGSNRLTARLCGVPIGMTIVSVYALAGLFFAIGGLLYFAEVKNGNPPDGVGRELEIIAAVVLGGGSLSGGRGSIVGSMIGALIIVVIRNGCTLLQIPNTYTLIIIGAIIIVAVVVDQLRHGSPEWLFRMLPGTTRSA